MDKHKHIIKARDAQMVWEWLKSRGGIAIWHSVDLSDPSWSCTTPVNDQDGNPKPKPHWKAEDRPHRVITDPDEVVIVEPKEVKRFHVATRMGSQGLSLKVTDDGSRRIRQAVAKAEVDHHCEGEAWYEFDYGDYENAVIYVPGSQVPIKDFVGA